MRCSKVFRSGALCLAIVCSGCLGGGREDAPTAASATTGTFEETDNGPDPWWPPAVDPAKPQPLVLSVQSESTAGVSPNDKVNLCLNLDVNTGTISGLQADLLWDPQCLAPEVVRGDEVTCQIEPATRRSIFASRALAPGRLRVLLVNLTDPSPMPVEVTRLGCCTFHAVGQAGERCEVYLDAVTASDPRGNRLPVEVRPGVVELTP
ncbi:hypothetical protein HRbin30_02899 [bacterium HR30]|nr:hypothetical protein HRbin30_02899 [bacterium HR30]